jgi:tetratricopeptide (TPR) repeat protein
MATSAVAQTNGIEIEKQKLKQALAYSDKSIAISSMYQLIALEGPQSTYKDSLAYVYFDARNFLSCFLVANDILSYKPENTDLIEISAISLESMGAIDKSAETYASLLAKTNNNYHAYKLAGLQLSLNKLDEAYATIQKADQMADKGNIKVTFQVNQNYNEEVALKAAIAYLEGVISLSLEKEDEAKLCFERAIGIFPNFVLAKNQLSSIEAPKE